MFPAREYMMRFFPILEKYPFLLVFCWLIRNWRFFRRICANKCKKAGFRFRVRLSDIQERLKGMIRREEVEEDLPEDTQEEMVLQAEREERSLNEEVDDGSLRKPDEISERESRDRGTEETEESRDEEAEEDTANIEQTEGDSDV